MPKSSSNPHESQIKYFIQALNHAQVIGTSLNQGKKLSQRDVCEIIGITIGTYTKYQRGQVHPTDVRSGIMRKLAKHLGVTTDSLFHYFETGEYSDPVGIDSVVSFIQSEAGTKDYPRILHALTLNSKENIKDTEVKVIQKVPKKPTVAECKRTGQLAAQHFNNIQREEVISAKAAWKSFVESEFSQMVETDHLNAILDVLRGEAVLTLEAMSEIYLTYGRCPVVTAFRKISELPLEVEFAQLVHNAELYIADQASKQNKSFEMSVVDV